MQPTRIPLTRGLFALSPIIVFLTLYLAVSLILGDFYKMPIAVALLASSIWAVATFRHHTLQERIETFSSEAGTGNILYMIWIFVLAGAFANLADKIGAIEATVAVTMNWMPPSLVIPGIFIAACFISTSIGTSVGTVVALTPLAVDFAQSVGGEVPFFVAVVLGGAFFGDNLSFISDTTIAATRTQKCRMNEKFKANFAIVFPAALATLAIYMLGDFHVAAQVPPRDVNLWLILPYLIIIALAIAGVNVTVTLLCGILTAVVIAVTSAGFTIIPLLSFMGDGIDAMGNLIIITLLAGGMLGIIKATGGIAFLLQSISAFVRGSRGAQASIAMLVGTVNLCTANNTLAILTVGSLSREISERYNITPRKSASLLDTASCIVQCLIPYGAQTLLATGLAGISPAAPWPYLYYPWILLVTMSVSIIIKRKKSKSLQ